MKTSLKKIVGAMIVAVMCFSFVTAAGCLKEINPEKCEHSWVAGKIITEPTYETEGEQEYVCEYCDSTKIEKIAKLACETHNWETKGTVEPTYVTDGYKVKKCSVCGKEEKETLSKLIVATEKMTLEQLNAKERDGFVKNATDENKYATVGVELGEVSMSDINYSEHSTGYQGKGLMIGSTNLNYYNAPNPAAGTYSFVFSNGTVTSASKGYTSIDGYNNASVYMLLPSFSDVVFENVTFKGVISFDIQKYTAGWSKLNSLSFKNCTFEGIIIGTIPAQNVIFDGCEFKNYTNETSANNSNPIWWRNDMEGDDGNEHPLLSFLFVNNTVTSTRPVKIERIGRHSNEKNYTVKFVFLDNKFDISAQEGDTNTKNMAINIGQFDNTSRFILVDDGNTISETTKSLYTAALKSGSNQYIANVAGTKILDRNGNDKEITATVWKTTTDETFVMKTTTAE